MNRTLATTILATTILAASADTHDEAKECLSIFGVDICWPTSKSPPPPPPPSDANDFSEDAPM